jgi:hypothetical protein
MPLRNYELREWDPDLDVAVRVGVCVPFATIATLA